jgi:hypothetical protein
MCSEFRDYDKELIKCGFRYKISDRDETDFLRLKFSYYFTTFMNDLDKYLLVINKIVRTEFFCTVHNFLPYRDHIFSNSCIASLKKSSVLFTLVHYLFTGSLFHNTIDHA